MAGESKTTMDVNNCMKNYVSNGMISLKFRNMKGFKREAMRMQGAGLIDTFEYASVERAISSYFQAEVEDHDSFCDYGDGLLSVHIYTETEMKMKGLETVRVVARKREQADHQTTTEVGPRKSLTNGPSWIHAAVGMLKFIFTTVQEFELRVAFMLKNGYISTDLHNDMMMYRYSYMAMYGCHDLIVDMLTIMDTITLVQTRTGGARNVSLETSLLIVSNEICYDTPFTNESKTPLKAIEWT